MTPTSVVVAGDRALEAGEDPEHGGEHPQREEEQRVARDDGHQGHRHRSCNQGLYYLSTFPKIILRMDIFVGLDTPSIIPIHILYHSI